MEKEEIKNEVKKVFASKLFLKFVYAVGIVLIAVIIFSAGVSFGFHRAEFARSWDEHYFNNFSPRHGQGSGPMMDFFPNANGADGQILKITLPTMIVSDKDDQTEKVVLITDDTNIRGLSGNINSAGLKIDDHVVVIGNPNQDGQITAKFIRVLPATSGMMNVEIPDKVQ